MKKISMLLSAIIMVFVVTGCDEKEEVKTFACTSKFDKYTNTTTLTSENGKVGKVKVTYAYDNEAMGVTSFNDVTDEQKEQIKTNMLTTLGFNDKTYEGFSINVYFDDQMKVDIEVDMDTVEQEALTKVGLNFSNTNLDYDDAVQSYRTGGFTCEEK